MLPSHPRHQAGRDHRGVPEGLVVDARHDVERFVQIDGGGHLLVVLRSEVTGDETSDRGLVPTLDVHRERKGPGSVELGDDGGGIDAPAQEDRDWDIRDGVLGNDLAE